MKNSSITSIVSLDSALSLAEQRSGLDWVHWMLQSVRQRCEGVVIPRATTKLELHANWRRFVQLKFIPTLGPLLLDAWMGMASRDPERLLTTDKRWALMLDEQECERSEQAGAVLLARTRAARYQAALGHYREAVEQGRCEGHIGIVWPCLAQLFQLSTATMLAEYLRLEWETAARDLCGAAMPVGSVAIAKIVESVLNPALREPMVMSRRKAS